MKTKEYLMRYRMACLILLATMLWTGCSDDDNKEVTIPSSSDLIYDTYLPPSIKVYEGERYAVNGKGFQNGDVLIFKSDDKETVIAVSDIAPDYAWIVIPEGLQAGIHEVIVQRGEETQSIGKLRVQFYLNIQVPDKNGMTIKGIVYSGKTPLEGVRVSDGFETAITNAEGIYWLPSDKRHGYVFICTPSGYQPITDNNAAPGFWETLQYDNTKVERFDFELEKVNNDKHLIVVATDMHLADRGSSSNNDMNQFKGLFMPDAARFITSQTLPLYTFVLGDMSWDAFWYTRSYSIADYKKTVSSFSSPMYHVMGNHDNDPYVADDFLAEAKYKETLGPTYYSMDIGKVHYVFLDNTVYINSGGATGTMGSRNYNKYLTDSQLNWLKEDLAAVTDKSTPIVVSFHCPSTNNYNLLFAVTKSFSPVAKTDEFHNCFSEFSHVHFLSGHTHYNANIQVKPHIREHNVAAVCETWWWAGKLSERSICKDGSPSGYKVFEVDGKDIKWYYKGVGEDRDKQFRVYDSNKVKGFFGRQDVINVMSQIPGRSNDFSSVQDNSIILNIWDYDPSWRISVRENEAELTAVRTYLRDPLHVLCYDYTRTAASGYTDGFFSERNSHIFVVPTNSSGGTLEITVTDGFGRVFKETMTRPKEFGKTMK